MRVDGSLASWAAACSLMVCGCATLQELLESAPKPSLQLRDVRFQGFDLDRVDLVFDVELENPYSVVLPLMGIDAALAGSGDPFVRASIQEQTHIPAQGARIVSVPVQVAFREALSVLTSVRPGQEFDYTADLVFRVDSPTGPLELPVQHQGAIWVPMPPKLGMPRVEVRSLSMQAVELAVQMEVGNPNQVALDLRRMQASVNLGGVQVASARAVSLPSENTDGTESTRRLEPGSQTVLELPLRLSVAQVGLGLLSALRQKDLSYRLSADMQLGTPLGLWAPAVDSRGRAPLTR